MTKTKITKHKKAVSPWHVNGKVKRLYAARAGRLGTVYHEDIGIDKGTCFKLGIRPINRFDIFMQTVYAGTNHNSLTRLNLY